MTHCPGCKVADCPGCGHEAALDDLRKQLTACRMANAQLCSIRDKLLEQLRALHGSVSREIG